MERSLIRRAVVPFLVLAMVAGLPVTALAAESPAVSTTPPRTAPPVPGDAKSAPAKISKEQALAIVTRYFGRLNGPGTVQPVLNQRDGRSVWELEYTVRRENGSWGTSLGAVDANTGRILNYRAYSPNVRRPRTGPLNNGYPESYARSWAWALVRDLYPEYVPQLTTATDETNPYYYSPHPTVGTYAFTWSLTKDGIPVSNRFIRIYIEKDTLDYVGLDQTLEPAPIFADGGVKLTPEEAMKAFAAVQPQLGYQVSTPYKPFANVPNDKPKVSLVYTFDMTPIAADSGQPIAIPTSLPTKPEPLPPVGAPAEPQPQLPMTQEQAMAMVRGLFEAPASAQTNTFPLRGSPGSDSDQVTISLSGPSGFYGSATVDLKTGRLLNANRQVRTSDPLQESPPAPTAEQTARAQAAAIALVQRLFPTLSSQVRVTQAPSYGGPHTQQTINFTFPRYQGDLQVPSNNIDVAIDTASLRWGNVGLNWQDDLSFPSPEQAISPEEARKVFLNGRKAQLVWLQDWTKQSAPAIKTPYGPTQGPPMRLAYGLSGAAIPSNIVDAVTGKLVDGRGQSVTPVTDTDKILAGHRAEGELRYLLDLGVIAPDKLKPDAPITRGDALVLFMNSRRFPFGGGDYGGPMTVPYADVATNSPLYATVHGALGSGILLPQGEKPSFGPDARLTRAEFAVWVARSLGLGKLARSGYKAEAPAGLTDPEQRNAVAFLEGLGILSGGEYTGPLTQADAAAITVRMIISNQNP